MNNAGRWEESFPDLGQLSLKVPIGGYRANFISWGHIAPQPWRNYLHQHSFFEVCYAYVGAGRFRAGDEWQPVGEGDVFVAMPGQIHEIVSSDAMPLGIYFWGFTLVRVPVVWTQTRGPESGSVDALLDRFTAPGGPAVTGASSSIHPMLCALATEAAQLDSVSGTLVGGQAVALVLDVARTLSGHVEPLAEPVIGREEAVAHVID